MRRRFLESFFPQGLPKFGGISIHYRIFNNRRNFRNFDQLLPLDEVTLCHITVFNPRKHEMSCGKSHGMSVRLEVVIYSKIQFVQ